jgi:hypothetical protein
MGQAGLQRPVTRGRSLDLAEPGEEGAMDYFTLGRRMMVAVPVLGSTISALVSGSACAADRMPSAVERPLDLADLDHCLDRALSGAEAASICERAAKHASKLDPSQQAALAHRRGQIALDQGHSAEAVVLLEAAWRLEPAVAPYLLTLADALSASGQPAQASAVYREGHKLAPSSIVFGERLRGLGAAPTATRPTVAER